MAFTSSHFGGAGGKGLVDIFVAGWLNGPGPTLFTACTLKVYKVSGFKRSMTKRVSDHLPVPIRKFSGLKSLWVYFC